ncbi:hypothetical protein ACEWY4_027698 [Coilia grayii]|uniref:C2H2-type domain-containing protein n=1 Tax=Coilia grayii TaxID=363190 RepID=A0ABD1INY9_9TELE
MNRKLQKHKICHTGERRHTCQTCGKRFGSTGDLRRHIRSHSGEKPYSCEMCGKGFTRSSVLRRHHSIHCKSFTAISLSSERKETQQENKSPHPHLTMSKAARADQCFGFCAPQHHPAPRSDIPTEHTSSMAVELQHTVPNHIFVTHSGKGPDSDPNSKHPQPSLSVEVSFCPFSGNHGPSINLAKL